MTTRHLSDGEPAFLLELDPQLASVLGRDGAESVGRQRLMPVVHVPAGPWRPAPGSLPAGTVALGVLEGLLLRETAEPGGASLSGPGDLVEPWSARPQLRWTACRPLHLAVVGWPLLSALQPWPDALARLLGRALSQEARQLDALAVASRRTDEQRMIGQLGQLAARWGHSERDGTVIALDLSPELLGRLAAVSPGSISRLVRRLGERGLALQRADGRWLLRGPDVLDATREALIAAFARASEAHAAALTATADVAARVVETARSRGSS